MVHGLGERKAMDSLRYLLVMFACCCVVAICSQQARGEEDYYKLLGVPKDASEQQIKRAFRKLAMKHHPDKNPDPEARKRFEKIANAYDVLSDADKRRQYDMFGAGGPQAQQERPFDYNAFYTPGGGHTGFEHRFNFNFNDMFKDFGGDSIFEHTHSQHTREAHDIHNFFNFDMDDQTDDSPFSFHFGGFEGFGNNFGGNEHHTGQRSQSCKTVTKRVGNTVTTYTTCS